MLFTRNIIEFHSFLFVTLHFAVTGNIEILAVEADSHTITLSWNNTNDIEDCNLIYVIAWKDTTDGSKNGCTFTTNNSYVINSLEACVTFKVSVSGLCGNCSEACEKLEASFSALYGSCNVSETAITDATTCPDGKWHVMCRFMVCAYNYFLL